MTNQSRNNEPLCDQDSGLPEHIKLGIEISKKMLDLGEAVAYAIGALEAMERLSGDEFAKKEAGRLARFLRAAHGGCRSSTESKS